MSSYFNDVVTVKECVYKRGGLCTRHNVKGTKVLKVTRVWDKLKNGLYGYRTVRRMTYQCTSEQFGGDYLSTTTAVDEFKLSKSKGLLGGTTENFTEVLKLPGLKRMCEPSLEPRPNEKKSRLQLL